MRLIQSCYHQLLPTLGLRRTVADLPLVTNVELGGSPSYMWGFGAPILLSTLNNFVIDAAIAGKYFPSVVEES